MMGKVMYMRKGEVHTKPSGRIPLGEIAVGSLVYLLENGTPIEYIVVNHGIPLDSTLYDSSCNGTWLLRKDVYVTDNWHSGTFNTYDSSNANDVLNGAFMSQLDKSSRKHIKHIKIPYHTGLADQILNTGSNGLAVRAFLLSLHELGGDTTVGGYIPIEGACLSYFKGTSVTGTDDKRVAYQDGTAVDWWTRTPYYEGHTVYYVRPTGKFWLAGSDSSYSYGIRPALIMSSTAPVGESNMVVGYDSTDSKPTTPSTHIITVVGSGNASKCYLKINETIITAAGDYEVTLDDTIECNVSGSKCVILNGQEVLTGEGSNISTYIYDITGNATIQLSYSGSSLLASSTITITEEG